MRHRLSLAIGGISHRHRYRNIGVDRLVVIDRTRLRQHRRHIAGRQGDHPIRIGRVLQFGKNLILEDDAHRVGRVQHRHLVERAFEHRLQQRQLLAHEEVFMDTGDVRNRLAAVQKGSTLVVVLQPTIDTGEHHTRAGLQQHLLVKHGEGGIVEGKDQLRPRRANLALDLLDCLLQLLARCRALVKKIRLVAQAGKAALFQRLERRLVLRPAAGIVLVVTADQQHIGGPSRPRQNCRKQYCPAPGIPPPSLNCHPHVAPERKIPAPASGDIGNFCRPESPAPPSRF